MCHSRRQRNKIMFIINTFPPNHISSFIKLASIVFELLCVQFSSDRRANRQIGGKPIVPSSANTGRGQILAEFVHIIQLSKAKIFV